MSKTIITKLHSNVGTNGRIQCKFNFSQLKTVSVLMVSMTLVACGSSGNSSDFPFGSINESTSIANTWARCAIDDNGTDSTTLVATFTSTGEVFRQNTKHVGSTTCDTSVENIHLKIDNTGIFSLNNAVTVDGSVEGIITATQFDFSNLNIMDKTIAAPFDLVVLNNNRLFFGDTSGNTDGSTLALRPTQLADQSLSLKRQSALASAALVGTWKSCNNNGDVDSSTSVQFTSSGITIINADFAPNSNCSGNAVSQEPAETASYELGSLVTVNGAVAGLTNATQLDITYTTLFSPSFGQKSFTIVEATGNKMFFGDKDNMTIEADRSRQLGADVFDRIITP
jgi:hypothetical protein